MNESQLTSVRDIILTSVSEFFAHSTDDRIMNMIRAPYMEARESMLCAGEKL